MKTLGIIPSRYASTRFPGKALALLGNKPVIQWVYERSESAVDTLCVATDDERIYHCVKGFGGIPVMTSPGHLSGTDRCAEALDIIENIKNQHYEVVVNIQGDEPFVDPTQINQLVQLFNDPLTQIATLASEISKMDDILDPNIAKVVVDIHDFALMFSRSPLPYLRGIKKDEWLAKHRFLKHIGVYAFLPGVLRKITKLPPSTLEKAESLEQLRWLENGYHIKLGISSLQNIGIDTPEDLEKATKRI